MTTKQRKRKVSAQPEEAKRSKTRLSEIYQACRGEKSQQALLENEESIIEILATSLFDEAVPEADYKQVCEVLVVWVSFAHGSLNKNPEQVLEFVPSDVVWTRCLKTLTSITADIVPEETEDWTLLAQVTHFWTIFWSNSQYKPSLVDQAAPCMGTDVGLCQFMSDRQRELFLKQTDLEQEYRKTAEERKNSKPFVVQVVHQILNLIEGDALKLGVKKHRETDEDPEIERHIEKHEDEEEEEEDEKEDKDERLHEWIFLHRAFELLIDLLSSSRFFLAPYLTSIHFTLRCRQTLGQPSNISFHRANENWFLSQQLLDRIDVLLHLSFDFGRELNAVEQLSAYHRRATTLQKMCHRYYADSTADLIYAGVGLLCGRSNASFLHSALGGLEDDSLYDILYKMRLVGQKADEAGHTNRDFLFAVLLDYLTLPDNPTQALQSIPLYPTESILWDFARIPPSLSSLLPLSRVLSLPKLQGNFLSFTDYLSRNFELMRLESAYEIRSDLVDVIKRMRPLLRQSMDVDDNGNEVTTLKTEFAGWARMALELASSLEITKVTPAKLGEAHPANVTAQFTIDLQPCGDSIRREWDQLGEFDNLFLVAIDASKMTGRPAPLLSEYHLHHGNHLRWDTDKDRRIPDEDDRTFPARFGVSMVRGCMIIQVKDAEGNVISEPGYSRAPQGTKRTFVVSLDPVQYSLDRKMPSGTEAYGSLNMVVRRQGRENNFKAVLESIRGLMVGSGSIGRVLPHWLQTVLLGQGDPSEACFSSKTIKEYARKTVGVANPEDPLDFGDTFLNEEHLRSSFGNVTILIDGKDASKDKSSSERRNYRLRISEKGGKTVVDAQSYSFDESMKGNTVPFTAVQVKAIRSGLSPGLTMVVGPPGTGKTDVAVQIISCLYHSFPTQRTIVITHSNAALNDIFQKVMLRGDVDQRYLLRLGAGERDLDVDSSHDFTKAGRVAYSLQRRASRLEEVQLLSESLGISGRAERGADGSPSYTCETAAYFYEFHVTKRIQAFERQAESMDDSENVVSIFPFLKYFNVEEDATLTHSEAKDLLAKLKETFDELEEYRPLELLRSQRRKTDYLIMKQARVVAMTCTHAAIARSHLIELGFEYDNVVIEEAGQMTEIETFIPLLLQKGQADKSSSGHSRLKRVCLMGDHNQLPPVIKNASFAHYSGLDQSLFSRLIRLGVSHVQLDKQGRARPEIAKLYNWRYKKLGDLDHVSEGAYRTANAGFVHTFQVINVDKFQGKGETTPTAYFYQNLGEAEYAIALFQYMVLIGYSPEKISILTTYNGQKELLTDILAQRCGPETPLAGVRPRVISTVDQYQGQQNDFVILSLVRTSSVGHLRDIRRLVVAVSRGRLGLYVLCRHELFAACHDLKRTFDQFSSRPTKLQLVLNESAPTDRLATDDVPKDSLFEVDDVTHFGSLVHQMQEEWLQQQQGEINE